MGGSTQIPDYDINPVNVQEKANGGRKMTLRIASQEAALGPIQGAQRALVDLYRGVTKQDDKKPAEERGFMQGVADWWNGLGKDKDDDKAKDKKDEKPSPGERSGWAIEGRTDNKDVSGDYKDLVGRAKKGENTLPDDAQNYIYLNVPGLFTEHYPGYFEKNNARMKEFGLDVRTVEIDTDASVETNAKVIRDAIMAIEKNEGKKVVLTGHSKGGVDISAALALYPELLPNVRAVVSMQAPYGGTPIAQDLATQPALINIVATAIRRLLKGDPKALTDLTYDSRQAFVEAHPYPEQVATVSLATSGGPMASPTAPAAMYMKKRYDLESDGLVPQNDAILPGSDVVKLDNMDHSGPAMTSPLTPKSQDQPGDITEALLTLALQKASAMEQAAPQSEQQSQEGEDEENQVCR